MSFSIGDRVIYNFNSFFGDWGFPPEKAIILNKSKNNCIYYGQDDCYKIKFIDYYYIEVVNVKTLSIDEEFYKREKREELIDKIIN